MSLEYISNPVLFVFTIIKKEKIYSYDFLSLLKIRYCAQYEITEV